MNIFNSNQYNPTKYDPTDLFYRKITSLGQLQNKVFHSRNEPKVTYYYKTQTFIPKKQSPTKVNTSYNFNSPLIKFNNCKNSPTLIKKIPKVNNVNKTNSRIYVNLRERKNNFTNDYNDNYDSLKFIEHKNGNCFNRSFQGNIESNIYENNNKYKNIFIYKKRSIQQIPNNKSSMERLRSKKKNKNNTTYNANLNINLKNNDKKALEEKIKSNNKIIMPIKITYFRRINNSNINTIFMSDDESKDNKENSKDLIKKKIPINKKKKNKTNLIPNVVKSKKIKIQKNIPTIINVLSEVLTNNKLFYWQIFKKEIFKKIKIAVNRKENLLEHFQKLSNENNIEENADYFFRKHSADIEGRIKKLIKFTKIDEISDNKLIKKNKELEEELKKIVEENLKLKNNQNNYTELENKYNEIIKNKNEKTTDNNNELLLKYAEIQNKTNYLLLEDKSLYEEFRKNKLTTDNSYIKFVKAFNSLNFKVKMRIIYLKYLFWEKIRRQKKLIKTYFDLYKNQTSRLLEIEKQEAYILKKNKRLRDLFYNKIRERKEWVHRCFTKFYFKGLLNSMKKGQLIIEQKTNENNENNSNDINTQNNEKNDEKPAENIENFQQNIENNNKNENKINEEKKPEENNIAEQKSKIKESRNKSRNLRKLLAQKSQQRLDTLRKAFYTFQCNGYLNSLKTMVKRVSRLKEEDLKKAAEKIKEEDANANREKSESSDESEKEKIEEEKIEKEKIEKEKNELNQKRLDKLRTIVFKKDRAIAIILKRVIENWNLRTKIISINNLGFGISKKKNKKAKKNKKKEGKNKAEKKEEDANNKNEEIENNN